MTGSRPLHPPIAPTNRPTVEASDRFLRSLAGGDLDAITPELVARAPAAGDAVASEVLADAGHALGLAVAGTIALLAPELVVLGGGGAQPGGAYWRAAEATARACSHVTEIDRIAVRPAALGYDAGVIGAALWGREQAGDRRPDTAPSPCDRHITP